MKKIVKAVEPYIYKGQLNFKQKPYEAWKASPDPSRRGDTLPVVKGWYPRLLHKLMFHFDMPTLWYGEARLVFVQPVSLYFDTFFVAPFHEMIPMVWDCWEEYDDMMVRWLKRHRIRKAIFTSEISAGRIKARVPELDILVITEGIDCENYLAGKQLIDREIDLLEFGRGFVFNANDRELSVNLTVNDSSTFKHVRTLVDGKFIYSDTELREAMGNAKVTIAVPRSDVNPKCHETLTQRYWECMLSRMVMVGRAPKELVELIGYDPVVSPSPSRRGDVDYYQLVREVVENIEEYQELVDRNREVALKMAPWEIRMKRITEWLEGQV